LPPNLSRCRQLPSTTKQTNNRLENLPLFFFSPTLLFSQVHDDIHLHVTRSVRRESTPAAYFPSSLYHVMTCQKFCSVSGGNLIKHIFSSRSREGISFFIMPSSLFA
jgi:hypothetical protein